jgi:hypothetical protein
MIFLFNGPPGSGKDEACSYFCQDPLYFKHLSFKHELFKATIKHFEVDYNWFFDGYTREEKDTPSLLLDGHSRREALIYVSEEIYKPIHGADVWGKQLATNIIDLDENVCVSDLGFEAELVPIINKVGAEKITIIQLSRNGCDFQKDSRRYVRGIPVSDFILGSNSVIDEKFILPTQFPVRVYHIHNNGTLDDFRQTLKSIYEKEQNVQNTKKESISRESI